MNYKNASRLKLRFSTNKGVLTTEDLWDLPLVQLDTLYKGLNKQLKEAQEESLLTVKTKSDEELTLRVEIITDIVKTKISENEVRRASAEKAERKQKLMKLIEEKQEGELGSKSIEELKEELNRLD